MKILFTGGGSAGHVTPNIALIQHIKDQDTNHNILYMGSRQGIERKLVANKVDQYLTVTVGKWRRYRSWRNALTPFQVVIGIIQALIKIAWHRPEVIFSKGGFVAFPAVVAGYFLRIPVLAHESDLTPGLANRLSYPFVSRILLAFAQTQVPKKYRAKSIHVGTPIRSSLLIGIKDKGLALCGFHPNKPCLLIMGGSSGAKSINTCIHDSLTELLPFCQIIHLCGKGNIDESLLNLKGYKQFDYVDEALPNLIACADIVISRAGANSIAEWLALKKPHLLIPLPAKASRGDQLVNAQHFASKGSALVRQQDDLNKAKLVADIKQLLNKKDVFIKCMENEQATDATSTIAEMITLSLHAYDETT